MSWTFKILVALVVVTFLLPQCSSVRELSPSQIEHSKVNDKCEEYLVSLTRREFKRLPIYQDYLKNQECVKETGIKSNETIWIRLNYFDSLYPINYPSRRQVEYSILLEKSNILLIGTESTEFHYDLFKAGSTLTPKNLLRDMGGIHFYSSSNFRLYVQERLIERRTFRRYEDSFATRTETYHCSGQLKKKMSFHDLGPDTIWRYRYGKLLETEYRTLDSVVTVKYY